MVICYFVRLFDRLTLDEEDSLQYLILQNGVQGVEELDAWAKISKYFRTASQAPPHVHRRDPSTGESRLLVSCVISIAFTPLTNI
jgi:hypothetical protein